MLQMALFFLLFSAGYIGSNIYLYVRLMEQLAGMVSWLRTVVATLYWVVASIFIFSMVARNVDMPYPLSRALFWIGSVWLIFVLYMALALAMVDVVRHFVPAFRWGFVVALVVVVGALTYGWVNARRTKTVRIDVVLDKPMSEPMTIVAISDVHLGSGTGREALRRYVEQINSHEPDLVVICGDLIDNSLLPVLKADMGEELHRIKARYGVYAVPGNHEYISGIEACERFFATTPVTLLRDSVVMLPSGVQLVGRDDRANKQRASLDELLSRCDMTRPVVVLDHQPFELAESNRRGVDVQFSGHTHNGQVFPLNLALKLMYEQPCGYRKWSHSHIYVSSGLSLWGPPFRIATQGDMAVMRLRGVEPLTDK